MVGSPEGAGRGATVNEFLLPIALSVVLVALAWMLRDKFRARRVHFEWAVGPAVNKQQKGRNVLEITITNEQKVKVTLTPKTGGGKPAQLDGTPSWTVSSGDSTLEASADGLSATLVSSDTPGETIFVVEADADLGEGVENITDAIKLTVQGARAASLGLSAGTPENK